MTHRTSRSTRSHSGPRRERQNLLVTVIVFIGLLLMGGFYLLTGQDPFGLFSARSTTPTVERHAITPGAATFTPLSEASGEATPPATGAGGSWWQVYFADPINHGDPNKPAGTIEEDLIRRINGAKKTIHIAAFEFDLTPVAEALIAAKKRGVEVQWVCDDENGLGVDNEKGHGQFAMLKKAGIPVKADNRGALMHNKFIIFDGHTTWTGSTNITVNGIFKNNNNALVIESVEVATMYERHYADLWAGKFGPSAPSYLDQQSVTIEGTPIQVLFAPEDHVMEHLVSLVKGAKRSVRFMAFSFTHNDLGQAMLLRAKAGVDVKGVFETRGSDTPESQLKALFCAKIPVRQDGNPSSYHHKVLIIDEKTVVTGSFNFSKNADQDNDENVVILTNTDIARQYLKEFDLTWGQGSDPKAADIKCK